MAQAKYNRKRGGVKRFNYAGGGSVQGYIDAYLAGEKTLEDIAKETGTTVKTLQSAIEKRATTDKKFSAEANRILEKQLRDKNDALAAQQRAAAEAAAKAKAEAEAEAAAARQQAITNNTFTGYYPNMPGVTNNTFTGYYPNMPGVPSSTTTTNTFNPTPTNVPAAAKLATDTPKPVEDTRTAEERRTLNVQQITKATQPQVATVDVETGITPDSAIQELDQFANLTPPQGVSASQLTSAVANVKEAVLKGTITPQQYQAALAEELNKTTAAQGVTRPPITVDEIRTLSAPAEAAQVSGAEVEAARAGVADYTISPDAFVPEVTVGRVNLAPTPQAEKQERQAITGTAPTGVEAQILEKISYTASQARAVKGTAAKGEAATMVAQVGDIPENITAAIVEDPATVEAQIDNEPINVQAAVAALPPEALVSSQMESLLGGLESGEVPAWAKPAVSLIEQNLAQRGMSASTVGRDSLFNAIIQSALPIAQSNAQALQARAAQNLSNQQQANLQTSQLDMTRRMQNLANQQTAGSQTAQMANDMAQLQSQFSQQATLASAEQAQQVRLQNLQNQQRSAELNAQNQQAMNAQNLSNAQQVELANLQIQSQTDLANMSAENQAKLAEFQTAAEFLAKNADLKQQMELANLSSEQQTRLANLSALNQAGADNLNAAQQTELANLNAQMQTNLAAAEIARQLNVAQLNVDQQRAVQNATTVANIDLTKFNAAQQAELANSQFMQSTTIANMNARQQAAMQNATAMASMDLATADQRTKLAIQNAQNFLTLDMANLSNQQQALVLDQQMQQQRLLSDQAATNAALQFNAANKQQAQQFMANLYTQTEQFNAAQTNAMAQFNATEQNRIAAINAGNEIDIAKFNNQLTTQLEQFNAQMDQQRELWNAQNAQAIQQSNIEWRRQANTIDTAAQNASNQAAAQMAFNLTAAELSNIWQQLRDEATYARTAYENEQQRKTTLYATALSNEASISETGSTSAMDRVVNIITGILMSGV